MRRGRWTFLRDRCESGQRVAPANSSTGNAGVIAGQQPDAGDIRQRTVQGTDGVRELGEGNDRRIRVRMEQCAKGVGARPVTLRGLGVMVR